MENYYDVKGLTAIITGGGNGIGKESALILAKSGANVVISDLDLDAAE